MDIIELLQKLDDLADAAEGTPAAEEAARLEELLGELLDE